MQQNKNISLFQLSTLLITFMMGTTIIINPEINFAGQTGWLADIVGLILGIVSVGLFIKLHQPYLFKKNIVQIAEMTGGKTFKIIISILYLYFAIHLGALNLRIIADFLTMVIMPNMPLIVISGILTLIISYAVWMGVETIGRVGQIILPVVLFIFGVLLLLSLPGYQVSNLIPINGNIAGILRGGLFIWSFPLGNLILFSFLLPYVKVNKKSKIKLKQYSYYVAGAMLIGGLILTMRTVALTMIMGPKLSSVFTYPIFSMVGVINIADFLERLETAFLIMWIGTVFIQVLICFWVAVETSSMLTSNVGKNFFILPLAVILTGFTQFLFENYTEQYQFLLHTWPLYTIIFIFVLPLIIYLLDKVSS